MSNKEFYQLGTDNQRVWGVAVWEPGDGIFCSNRNMRSKVECGAPVAVLRKKLISRYPSKYDQEVITRNICSHHLASSLKELKGDLYSPSTESDKEAKEFILAKYWDEYQAEFDKRVEAKREAQLECLPEVLRDAIRNLEEAAA